MVIKRGMNRKGQNAEAGSTVGGLLIVLAVVVVVLLGIYLVYSNAQKTIATMSPEELRVITERCNLYAGDPYPQSFCEFVSQTVGGKGGFVNCQYPEVRNRLIASGSKWSEGNLPDCGPEIASVREECKKVTAKQFDSILFNAKTCAEWGAPKVKCSDIRGLDDVAAQWVQNLDKCTGASVSPKGVDKTSQVQALTKDEDSTKGTNKVCCLFAPTSLSNIGTKAEGSPCGGSGSRECISPFVCELDPRSDNDDYTCQRAS